MSAYYRLIIRTLLTLLVIVTPLKVSAANQVVTLSNGEWPPFTSQDLAQQGFISEIVRQAFALQGYNVHYQFLPWARAYRYAESGRVDGSVIWTKTPHRLKTMLFSEPVFQHTYVFFYRAADNFNWREMSDLRGFRIGGSEGYSYGYEFDQAVKRGELNIDYVSSDILNLKKLQAKRIDLFPSDIQVGYYLLKQLFPELQAEQFKHHPKPIVEIETHVLFSKVDLTRGKLLQAAFNKGLQELRANGTYQKLVEQASLSYYSQTPHRN
ncbi:substrate-binding periplasmic protein [Agarivorans gilvus]|uniref:ABC transporter substrate-binding protein n=1 Tax=Agarivorans gilvus TaxID=680279 RepID=A0ABQ1I1F2_9ALTE|nr:transporter substrate-binding domain-containing protein [Agarivorans gilvus]GGA99749.1 ABC transporter substrate-binding protein [Agarivorans gilvus]